MRRKRGRRKSAPFSLLLLLALGVRLVAVLMGSLRMLLRGRGMLFTLGMVSLAVMFRSRPVCLCGVLVVLRSLVMLVSCHRRLLVVLPVAIKASARKKFRLLLW